MYRRTLLKAAAAALTAPYVIRPASAQAGTTLRFVPQGALSSLDPLFGTSYVIRNAALLVWDTLYGVDENLVPRRQMVEEESVTADGLQWTFRLRPGLVFHDGQPVQAKDAVASLRRWARRDTMGLRIAAIQDDLSVIDERTFRWSLKSPFPKMLYALAKSNAPCAFVLPERVASTDPTKVITEYVGSGPMRLVEREWVPGAKIVFEQFANYNARPEAASWMAGGKRMQFKRIEWFFQPDGGTAVSALQSGEVDWLETPLPDLMPLLEADRNIKTGIVSDLGIVSGIRLNHLQPPFDNPVIRRAILTAVNQDDYLAALTGGDKSLGKRMHGFFTPGSPLYNEAGGSALTRGGDLQAARRMVADSGYAGAPIKMLVAQDVFNMKASGDVAHDMMRKIGLNAEYVALDFPTTQSRRTSKASISKGGWHTFQVSHAGIDCINPAAYLGLRANGEGAWFGWPNSPDTEAGIARWYNSLTIDDEKAAAKQINESALNDVIFVPTGCYLQKQAWRANVRGVKSAPLPVFWDVSKSQ